MRRTELWKILIPLFVAVALASAITVSVAGPPFQDFPSSEEGIQPKPSPGASTGDAASHDQLVLDSEPGALGTQISEGLSVPAEPQPDEDSYTGKRIPVDLASIPPSEGAVHQGPPDWEGILTEPQRDQDAYYESSTDSLEAWSSLLYVDVAGTTLRPRDSSAPWRYGGGGCVYVERPIEMLNIHLALPEGSRIDYLRLYYYDIDLANSTAWLTRYDHSGGHADVLVISSEGDSGFGTVLSAYSGQIVDNISYTYVLNWQPTSPGENLQLCALRVAYRVPE